MEIGYADWVCADWVDASLGRVLCVRALAQDLTELPLKNREKSSKVFYVVAGRSGSGRERNMRREEWMGRKGQKKCGERKHKEGGKEGQTKEGDYEEPFLSCLAVPLLGPSLSASAAAYCVNHNM